MMKQKSNISTTTSLPSGKADRKDNRLQQQKNNLDTKKLDSQTELRNDMNQHLIANQKQLEKIDKHMENQSTMFLTIMEFFKGKNNTSEKMEDKITIDSEEQEEQKRMEDKRKNEHRDPENGSVNLDDNLDYNQSEDFTEKCTNWVNSNDSENMNRFFALEVEVKDLKLSVTSLNNRMKILENLVQKSTQQPTDTNQRSNQNHTYKDALLNTKTDFKDDISDKVQPIFGSSTIIKKPEDERKEIDSKYIDITKKLIDEKNYKMEIESERIEKLKYDKKNSINNSQEYFLRKKEVLSNAQLTLFITINNDLILKNIVNKIEEGTKDEKNMKGSKKVLNHILKQLDLRDDVIKNMNIAKVTYSRRTVKDVLKDTILVEFTNFSTIKNIKGNLGKLSKDYSVCDYIPTQFRDIHAIYSKMGSCYYRDGKVTKIWMNHEGFTLRVKDRTDMRSWSEIAPIIPLTNMPLAYLGKMSKTTETEIKKIENDRIKEIISRRDIRENEKENRIKYREENKEKKKKEFEENEISKKRNLSLNSKEDQINAKKVINEAEDCEMEMDDIQKSNTDIPV